MHFWFLSNVYYLVPSSLITSLTTFSFRLSSCAVLSVVLFVTIGIQYGIKTESCRKIVNGKTVESTAPLNLLYFEVCFISETTVDYTLRYRGGSNAAFSHGFKHCSFFKDHCILYSTWSGSCLLPRTV